MLGEPGLPRWDWQRRSELGVLWLRFFFPGKQIKQNQQREAAPGVESRGN